MTSDPAVLRGPWHHDRVIGMVLLAHGVLICVALTFWFAFRGEGGTRGALPHSSAHRSRHRANHSAPDTH